MILGHNVDSVTGYAKRRQSGVSHGDRVPGHGLMPTWSKLYQLLENGGVDLADCFFTNVFVGLKVGDRNEGRFTAHPTIEFSRWCREFLAYQVRVMRPRVVVVLGQHACVDLAEVVTPTPWSARPFPPPMVVDAQLFGWQTALVPVRHPSRSNRISLDAMSIGAAWGARNDDGQTCSSCPRD